MRKSILILLILIFSITTTQASMDESYNPLVLEHDGLERVAHVYQPEGEINAVMIALHGFMSSARALEAQSGLNTIADQRNWVIVYPESYELYWDDGRSIEGLPPVRETVDDAGYLALLSDTLRESYNVDNIYLSGLANGATMAMRAVCETPDKYDGVAFVNALIWSYQEQYCDSSTNPINTNIIQVKGSDDEIYWTEGRVFPVSGRQILSAEENIFFWGDQNACESFINPDLDSSGLVLSQNCNDDTTVAYLPVIGGSNNWSRTGDLNNIGIDTARLISAFLAGDENWQDYTIPPLSIEDTTSRSYVLYVPPSYDPTTPTPVVLSLHGRGANNFAQAISSDWNTVADEHGFIVVYPQASDGTIGENGQLDSTWNYTRNTSMHVSETDDDAYLDAIVDELATVLNVDMNRLYVNGLSNGGYMTHRLACTRSDRYAAFATMAGSAPFGIQELCDFNSGSHAPIMIYHGTADIISPWAGAEVKHPRTDQEIFLLAPIEGTLDFWLHYNQCELSYEQSLIESSDRDSTPIYVHYTGCPDDAAVELYAIVGGGHLWHGITENDNILLGESNMDVNASEAIWEFYSRYTLDGRDDTNTVEWNLPVVESITGEGIPSIPLSLVYLELDLEANPELQAVAALQRGGLTLYMAMDFSQEFDCASDSIDEQFLANAEAPGEAFRQMHIQIGQVVTQRDCRAEAAGAYFDSVGERLTFSPSVLTAIMARGPGHDTISVIIGDAQLLAQQTGNSLEAGNTVIIQSNGTGATAIGITPTAEWIRLADQYQRALDAD